MISRILALSIQHRWVVVLVSLGGHGAGRLVADPAADRRRPRHHQQSGADQHHRAWRCRPAEIEKQVTFRIETALAGIPGLESTRSISRNGFSQVTAVFTEKTDIYFARQQVSERLMELRAASAARRRAEDGADLDRPWRNLHVDRRLCVGPRSRDGAPGSKRRRVSDARGRTASSTDIERAAYLRTVQDWIIRPQIKSVTGVAGVDSIGGYVKQYQVQPDPSKLIALGLSFADVVKAIEANNVSRGASVIERNGEGIVVRTGGRLENIADIGDVVVTHARRRSGSRPRRRHTSRSAAKSEPAAPAKTAMRSWSAPR